MLSNYMETSNNSENKPIVETIKTSSMKSYKLNKTFENSIYPIEIELKEINKNTLSNSLNNLAAAIFSGIGTSILFQDNCMPKLLKLLYCWLGLVEGGVGEAICNIVIVIILFWILYFIGLGINKHTRKKHELYEKKATSEGRRELAEIFHKSVINDIVTGISFVDKAEELEYNGDVAKMYLYESAYYFIRAKIQMEKMEVLSPEKDENHSKFIEEVGLNTMISTCKVYNAGLNKLETNIPDGNEKEIIGKIIEAIEPYVIDYDTSGGTKMESKY